MKRNNILITFIAILASAIQSKAQISETRYDYTELAKHITEGCNTKAEQAHNIYLWICQNISYDTEYKINNADDCYDNRKGVCQGYCELFYRLGEPLGLKTTIISGRVKNQYGQIEKAKHAWLCVEAENGNILIDPTWGAGSVKDNVFIQSNNDMSWFQIDPYWLIFTHYPDDANYQFVENNIDWKTFTQLPVLYPSSTEYGWDGKEMLIQILNGSIPSLPKVYEQYTAHLSFIDIPLQATLKPGHFYTFILQKKTANKLALIHDGEFVYEEEWQSDGNNHTLQYMPVSAGTLLLAIAKEDNKYNAVVAYHVSTPNQEELRNIEKHSPIRMAEIKRLKNMDLKKWKAIGTDGHKMLNTVRQKRISSLPIFYKNAEKYLRDVEIPFSETLQAGQSYIFSFIPQGGLNWQIINEKDWYGNWQKDETTGRYTMQITPLQTGKLRLSVQIKEGGPYESLVGYQVK